MVGVAHADSSSAEATVMSFLVRTFKELITPVTS
jgi:hypothetical protein